MILKEKEKGKEKGKGKGKEKGRKKNKAGRCRGLLISNGGGYIVDWVSHAGGKEKSTCSPYSQVYM